MTSNEYAIRIYCHVFRVDTDNGEAYIRGILDTVKTLEEREQIALESFLRYGKSFVQIGADMGISEKSASNIVNQALRKLRHPYRFKNLSVKRTIMEKNKLLCEAAETINSLYNQIDILAKGGSLEPRIAVVLESRKKRVSEINLSNRAVRMLLNVEISTVESLLALDTLAGLMKIKGFGKGTKEEIIRKMEEQGCLEWAKRMRIELIARAEIHKGRAAGLLMTGIA